MLFVTKAETSLCMFCVVLEMECIILLVEGGRVHGICHKLLGLFVLDLVGEMEFDFRLSINLKVVRGRVSMVSLECICQWCCCAQWRKLKVIHMCFAWLEVVQLYWSSVQLHPQKADSQFCIILAPRPPPRLSPLAVICSCNLLASFTALNWPVDECNWGSYFTCRMLLVNLQTA